MREWIKCEDAMPRLKRKELQINAERADGTFGDWAIYYSDSVAVLFSDGYIKIAQWQAFDGYDPEEDLTTEDYFFSPDEDEHINPVAWLPLNEIYPEWFKKEEEE